MNSSWYVSADGCSRWFPKKLCNSLPLSNDMIMSLYCGVYHFKRYDNFTLRPAIYPPDAPKLFVNVPIRISTS